MEHQGWNDEHQAIRSNTGAHALGTSSTTDEASKWANQDDSNEDLPPSEGGSEAS